MFKENRCKIFKYLHCIAVFFSVSLFVGVFYNVKLSHGEEGFWDNVFNVKYESYNPYTFVEEQVNNGEIVYKETNPTNGLKNTRRSFEEGEDDYVNIKEDDEEEIQEAVKDSNRTNVATDYDDNEENNEEDESEGSEDDEDNDEDEEEFDNDNNYVKKQTLYKKTQRQTKRKHEIVAGLFVGSSGFGLDLVYNYWFFGFRFSGAFLKLPVNGLLKEYIDLDLHGYNVGLSVFFRPFQGTFHIDVGVFYFNHGITGNYNIKLLPSKDVAELADYYLNTTMVLGLKFRTGIVPYVGCGWDINVWKNLFINIDVGLFVTGELKYQSLDFKINKGGLSNANQRLTGLEMVMSYDTVKSILGKTATNVLEKLVVWPVVKIGFGYRFNL